MSWHYDSQLSGNRDKVRFLIQDTDSTNELCQDEEIDFALTAGSNDVFSAAAICCRALATQFIKKVGLRDPQTGIVYDTERKAEFYLSLAEEFEAKSGKSFVPKPFAGGISQSDKETRKSDGDRVDFVFTTDLHAANLNLNGNSSS
jgi:hypothetical protein